MNPGLIHVVLALATIVAMVILAVTGQVAGSDAVVVITAVSGVMLGASSTAMGKQSGGQ